MTHDFDKDYWEQKHREQRRTEVAAGTAGSAPHPYLARETAGLAPGTALDAGSGTGAEAVWLAVNGWQVTAADISAIALAECAVRAELAGVSDAVHGVEADLTTWQPGQLFDLVATSYAHPALAQLDFYTRISRWVAPGGTLLIVGHLHDGVAAEHAHTPEHAPAHSASRPPAEATVTLAAIVGLFNPQDGRASAWQIETAAEHSRTLATPGGSAHTLRDVVVRARRRG